MLFQIKEIWIEIFNKILSFRKLFLDFAVSFKFSSQTACKNKLADD